jgi:hypothetical protein
MLMLWCTSLLCTSYETHFKSHRLCLGHINARLSCILMNNIPPPSFLLCSTKHLEQDKVTINCLTACLHVRFLCTIRLFVVKSWYANCAFVAVLNSLNESLCHHHCVQSFSPSPFVYSSLTNLHMYTYHTAPALLNFYGTNTLSVLTFRKKPNNQTNLARKLELVKITDFSCTSSACII